ncbi:mannose-6-phosphate isomerase, class I [Vibrio sp. 10N.286.52.B1]|uniref:mannose-6-phosphate isomerase, class I n=1 Tax=Vibrio sp. 10N.286.52.B1 TaxID=3229712 RepID=UPI00354FEC2B
MQNESFYKLENSIQNYPWGSVSSIPDLFDVENPAQVPMAEIWMGAHPKASSKIQLHGQSIELAHFISASGSNLLGEDTKQRYGELPYLFKVLAANQALSIQVHPSKEEAEVGFAKENQLGIAMDAYNRNYKDANHKPELVYALTPYLAMNGFRDYNDIVTLFVSANLSSLQNEINHFSNNQTPAGLRALFQAVLSLEGDKKDATIQELLTWTDTHQQDSLATLVLDLNTVYPNDVGLLAPLMLNVILLQPGEAMFLDAGTPHAYLKGTALELMANSDNVLRAGLTPKYIDVEELVASCRFYPLDSDKILTSPISEGCEQTFPVPVDDFSFAVYQQPDAYSITLSRAEIWFAIDQDATFVDQAGQQFTISKGESIFIPLTTDQFTVSSSGTLARAY